MKKSLALALCTVMAVHCFAQLKPSITNWLQNNTTTGYYYMAGNSTPISHGILVNCQKVEYSTNNVYVRTTGMPSYNVGPYLDGNPNQAGNQNAIYKFPLNPVRNTGTPTATTGGSIGVFVNGVSMFDFRDGVAWNATTNAYCGGPGNPPCPGGPGTTQSWMRDAVVFEKSGFDCSKGHPAGTNYHHHQNPSAFDMDIKVISAICNLYDADGLYTINPAQHSPLIGFAFDGFPVYGAYGYANANGTGGITRIKSGYQKRNITVRTHWADGTDVADGPPVSATYPLGTFREDYEWVAHPGDESYLDEHNGRFCTTPEYPNGTYAYFTTVDSNYNSVYPYIIGPTYYGVKTGGKVIAITETTTVYNTTLPLQLLKFSAYRSKPSTVAVEWITAAESNVSHFEVERSTNAANWKNIGRVNSNSNSAAENSYKYMDKLMDNVSANDLYYRIKMVNTDGSYIYSPIKNIKSSNIDEQAIKVFPNPAADFIVIQLSGLLSEDITLQLVDSNGKLVSEKKINKGQTIAFIETQTLYAGVYYVKFINNNTTISRKVILNK